MTETYTYYRSHSLHSKWMINSGILISLLILLSAVSVKAQDCTTEVTNTFACNEQVNVSLGGDCIATINAATVTEGLLYDESSYTVVITDADGNILPTNIVGPEHHQMMFTVSVTQICSGYNCWGLMYVEDKVGPTLTCTTAISDCMSTEPEDFGFPTPPLSIVTLIGDRTYTVSPTGACDDYTLTYRDRKEDHPCDSMFIQTIYRTWRAEDARENVTTCIDTISVLPGTIADITLPPHYDNIDQPAFECNDILDTLPNGNPSLEETGMLGGIDCVNIISYYEDLNFQDVCGASKKILRSWNVLDWCSGEELVYDQVIKILDMTDPIITEVEDTIIYTLPQRCYGKYEVPLPLVEDCSDWTYTVRHRQVDTFTNAYTGSTTDYVTYDTTTNLYTINELPFGESWISINVRDDCGFEVDTFYVVDVQDIQLPNPVCDAHTTLSLDNNNTAKLFASSLNDGSLDNCGIVDLQLRRMVDSCDIPGNTIFGEFVQFCCADAGDVSMVEFRVEDRSGNVNTCMIEVRIEDELPPIFRHCPKDTIIDCSIDYLDLDLTGRPDVYDNCNFTLTYSDLNKLNSCGIGSVTRSFRAQDDFGNYSECWQEITVTSDDTIKLNSISWPEDRTEYGCLNGNFTPAITGEPEVHTTGCARLWVDYKDEIFYSLDNQCSKILRTWRVTNECLDWYNTAQEFTHIQYIKVIEEEKPVFASCKDTIIVVSGDFCLNEIDLDFEATDNCTPEKELKYRFSIDEDLDGYAEVSGVGNSLTEDFTFGTAIISFTAEDHCGNVGECEFQLTVNDEKAPTPICVPVSWSLGEHAEVEIWASDFSLKSFDNCTPEFDLKLSFTEDVDNDVRIFTCADIENGIGAEIPITLYVTDESGNFDFCETKLTLIDSNNKCEDAEEQSARVGGYIETEDGHIVKNVDVEVNIDSQEPMNIKTADDGAFMMEGLSLFQNLTISPEKIDNPTSGVTTLDLVLIQKHILGVELLTSPYKLIAADINNSNSVSAADLIQLRKIILGISEGFPNNKSWRFVDRQHAFIDIMNPWSFPEQIAINELLIDQMENDFIGVKVGDINGSVVTSGNEDAVVRSEAQIIIDQGGAFEKDGKILIPVLLDGLEKTHGMQFEFGIGDNRLVGIKPAALDIEDFNFKTDEGVVRLSWNTLDPIALDKKALFYLEFNAAKYIALDGEIIKLVDGLKSEVYTVDLDVMALNIHLRDHTQFQANTITSNVVLLQNNPNPFTNHTIISIESNVEEVVEMNVVSIHGVNVMKKKFDLIKGVNKVQIEDTGNWGAGIYFYTLKGESVNASMKMVKH